jgi:hypothetical protein
MAIASLANYGRDACNNAARAATEQSAVAEKSIAVQDKAVDNVNDMFREIASPPMGGVPPQFGGRVPVPRSLHLGDDATELDGSTFYSAAGGGRDSFSSVDSEDTLSSWDYTKEQKGAAAAKKVSFFFPLHTNSYISN